MRVYSIVTYQAQSCQSEITYLNDFSFWQRSTVLQIIRDVSRISIGLTKVGQQQSIIHEGYLCHVINQSNGLSGAIITDEEYPSRIALNILFDYLNHPFPPEDLVKFQDPTNFDKLTKIKKDLDDTREIVLHSIEQLIERGEKLENLEERTDILVKEARKFKTQTDELNSCCIIL